MDIYFELSVARLQGRLISVSNPVGLVCPGGWQHALSDWSCGVFIKCESGGCKPRLFPWESQWQRGCREAGTGFPPCFLEFSADCYPHVYFMKLPSSKVSNLIFTQRRLASACGISCQLPIYCVHFCTFSHLNLPTSDTGLVVSTLQVKKQRLCGAVICPQAKCVSSKAGELTPQSC